MKTTAFALLFAFLAGVVQAQPYKALLYGTPELVPVPLIVETAFQRAFPLGVVDSCFTYHQTFQDGEEVDKYEFAFTHKGRPKQVTFNGQGKLTELMVEVALDTLPKRVRRTLTEHLTQSRTSHESYEIRQGYATVDMESTSTTYTIVFDAVSFRGKRHEDSLTMDDKGRCSNPKFR